MPSESPTSRIGRPLVGRRDMFKVVGRHHRNEGPLPCDRNPGGDLRSSPFRSGSDRTFPRARPVKVRSKHARKLRIKSPPVASKAVLFSRWPVTVRYFGSAARPGGALLAITSGKPDRRNRSGGSAAPARKTSRPPGVTSRPGRRARPTSVSARPGANRLSSLQSTTLPAPDRPFDPRVIGRVAARDTGAGGRGSRTSRRSATAHDLPGKHAQSRYARSEDGQLCLRTEGGGMGSSPEFIPSGSRLWARQNGGHDKPGNEARAM